MVFYLLQIQLRRDNPCTASVQYLIRTRGGGGCNGKERRSQEPEFRMQEFRRGGLTASAEQTKKQNAQPRMNADLRGYDSLILFKKITKLTKADVYLCDLCDSRLNAVQIAGASGLSQSSISTIGLVSAQRTPVRRTPVHPTPVPPTPAQRTPVHQTPVRNTQQWPGRIPRIYRTVR